jgi:hypothetical protein
VDGWQELNLEARPERTLVLNRRQAAVLIDAFLNPFELEVDFKGRLAAQPVSTQGVK